MPKSRLAIFLLAKLSVPRAWLKSKVATGKTLSTSQGAQSYLELCGLLLVLLFVCQLASGFNFSLRMLNTCARLSLL
jgi:hypothetical protein